MDQEARAVLERMKMEVEEKVNSWESEMGLFEGKIAQTNEVFSQGLGQAISSSQDISDIKVEMATKLAEAATAVKMLGDEVINMKGIQAKVTADIAEGFQERG